MNGWNEMNRMGNANGVYESNGMNGMYTVNGMGGVAVETMESVSVRHNQEALIGQNQDPIFRQNQAMNNIVPFPDSRTKCIALYEDNDSANYTELDRLIMMLRRNPTIKRLIAAGCPKEMVYLVAGSVRLEHLEITNGATGHQAYEADFLLHPDFRGIVSLIVGVPHQKFLGNLSFLKNGMRRVTIRPSALIARIYPGRVGIPWDHVGIKNIFLEYTIGSALEAMKLHMDQDTSYPVFEANVMRCVTHSTVGRESPTEAKYYQINGPLGFGLIEMLPNQIGFTHHSSQRRLKKHARFLIHYNVITDPGIPPFMTPEAEARNIRL